MTHTWFQISECCEGEKKCDDGTCIPNKMNNCENWCPTICENDEKLCPGKVNENNCMTEDICISKDGKIILYNKKGMILNLGQFPIYVPLP